MQIPTLGKANELLEEAAKFNPGLWVDHSINVARAAQAIADHHPALDAHNAYILGLLHDIGRRQGVTGMRHALDGYNFMYDQGYDDSARICLTHSFPHCDIMAVFGDWDCSESELTFIKEYLSQIEFNDYDRLLQLCDSIAMASGVCLMEKRMVDVALRYGVNDRIVAKWSATFQIKADFETVIGQPIYRLFPEVFENTFGFSRTER